jgi:uncharacterized NAD-dependent epimerase/dehydratase family protein
MRRAINKALNSKWANVINSAIERGENAYAATHYLLQQQDPDYNKAMNDGEE